MIRASDVVIGSVLIIVSLSILCGVGAALHEVAEPYELPIEFASFVAVVIGIIGGLLFGRMMEVGE